MTVSRKRTAYMQCVSNAVPGTAGSGKLGGPAKPALMGASPAGGGNGTKTRKPLHCGHILCPDLDCPAGTILHQPADHCCAHCAKA